MISHAVVPVAGLGTRLLPVTKAVPKELLPVGGKPVVAHIVEELAGAGIERVLFVTRRDKRAIEEHFGAGDVQRTYGYVLQPQPRGLGDAVLCAEGHVAAGPFAVALGDCPYTGGGLTRALIDVVESGRADAAVAVERVGRARASRYGIVVAGADGIVTDLVEKPADPPSDLAIAARYVLPPTIFAALRATAPGAGGELQLTDALALLVRQGLRLAAIELPAGVERHDVGSIEGYERAFDAFRTRRVSTGVRVVDSSRHSATAVGRAPARAALAGNPSDGFGGRTLAVCIEDFAAEAEVTAAPRSRIVAAGERSLGALADQARAHGADGAERLASAALVRFVAEAERQGRGDVRDASVEIRWRTTIPRQVGLAGSSAIVIATLRALAAYFELELAPVPLAHAALAAETEELGIAAGLQDRVCQAYGGLVAMDFASHEYEPLAPELLPPLVLAWRADASEPSGVVHSDLRHRHAAGDAAVHDGMRELAQLAARARDALLCGDLATLHGCVDASFDVRRRIVALDPSHVRMVELLRAHGAAANYAGSGGAVVGPLPAGDPDGAFAALAAALAAEGYEAIRPTVASSSATSSGSAPPWQATASASSRSSSTSSGSRPSAASAVRNRSSP